MKRVLFVFIGLVVGMAIGLGVFYIYLQNTLYGSSFFPADKQIILEAVQSSASFGDTPRDERPNADHMGYDINPYSVECPSTESNPVAKGTQVEIAVVAENYYIWRTKVFVDAEYIGWSEAKASRNTNWLSGSYVWDTGEARYRPGIHIIDIVYIPRWYYFKPVIHLYSKYVLAR